MSILKQILRGLVIGLVLVCLILLGLYLARLPKPKPKHVQAEANTTWMGWELWEYVHRHGVPPYSKKASLDGYLEELSRGTGGLDMRVLLRRHARYVVFVNLTRREWAAVRSSFEGRRTVEGKMTTEAGEVLPIIAWSSIAGAHGERWFILMSRLAHPRSAEEFRAEVRQLDRAIRASLGKSLADCLLYGEKHFHPSTLELEDD